MEKYDRPRQATEDEVIRYICFACCINKATNTHSEHEIFFALPLQQWFLKRVTRLPYTYIVSLVTKSFPFIQQVYHSTLFGVTHRQCLYKTKTKQIALKMRTFTALYVSVTYRILKKKVCQVKCNVLTVWSL